MEIILIILAGALGVMVGYFTGAAKVALLKGDLVDANYQIGVQDGLIKLREERIAEVVAERDAALAKLPVRGAGGKFVTREG